MDEILTISFKITAEIEITKHMHCVLLCRRGRVSLFGNVCKAKLCSFIHSLLWNMRLHCFFTVNRPVNRAWSSCGRKVHPKGIKSKTFPRGYVISLSGVVVRSSRVQPKVLGSNPTQLFFSFLLFFSRFFCVVIFYKYIPK